MKLTRDQAESLILLVENVARTQDAFWEALASLETALAKTEKGYQPGDSVPLLSTEDFSEVDLSAEGLQDLFQDDSNVFD